MDVKALIEKMKKEDRLLSEDAVMKAVQQSLVKLGYEPLGDEVLSIFEALENIPVAYDVEKVMAELEEQTEFLKDCTKYGNKDAEQQHKSYSTMMMYEIAGMVEDLIDIVKRGGVE